MWSLDIKALSAISCSHARDICSYCELADLADEVTDHMLPVTEEWNKKALWKHKEAQSTALSALCMAKNLKGWDGLSPDVN